MAEQPPPLEMTKTSKDGNTQLTAKGKFTRVTLVFEGAGLRIESQIGENATPYFTQFKTKKQPGQEYVLKVKEGGDISINHKD